MVGDVPDYIHGVGTVTAGPLNGTSQQATVTVTAAGMVTLTVTPPVPTIAKGQTQQSTATGTRRQVSATY